MKSFKIRRFHLKDIKSYCKVIIANDSIRYIKNGCYHRIGGPAIEYPYGSKSWYYKDKLYGLDDDFTNKTWKEKIIELKREEELEIFK